MNKTKREKETKEFWLGHKEAWLKSGKSKQEYAKKNGISKHVFYKWCQRLEGSEEKQGNALNPRLFHPVKTERREDSGMRLHFPNGLILEIPGDMAFPRLSELFRLWF